MADVHMLLVYSLAEQRLINTEEFTDSREALSRYENVERDHIHDRSVEIVLIAADSTKTIEHTHASYFRGDISVEELDLDSLLI